MQKKLGILIFVVVLVAIVATAFSFGIVERFDKNEPASKVLEMQAAKQFVVPAVPEASADTESKTTNSDV